MWLLVVVQCFTAPSGDRCVSHVLPVYLPSHMECRNARYEAVRGMWQGDTPDGYHRRSGSVLCVEAGGEGV